ncbi:MAG: VTT domain-containing protein [Candidatus Gracilibacteria bacterium]
MNLIDFFLHLDEYLSILVGQFGWGSYLILFGVVFLETGLVFTPFLPGDSLIFVASTLAAQEIMDIKLLWALFTVAAITGDSVNYWVGSRLGKKIIHEKGLLKVEYLKRTEDFYAKYGKKTIIIARFIPIIRTFAPFVAGIARMNYRTFLIYNICGGIAWVSLFTLTGYFFGELPWVQDNLHILIVLIIVVSLLPPIWEYIKSRK